MKIPKARRVGWQVLVTSLLALAAVGWQRPAEAAEDGPPAGWTPLEAERLDALRGGWSLPSGLVVSFGFERLAWVNGELVASTRIDIPDVANLSGAQARELDQLRQTQVVQVGPGNAFDGVAGAGPGLVLQNSLDGTQIRVLTTLEAGTNALGMLQAANFTDAMGRAGLGAVGSP
jgi:hypothetical protein